LVSCVVGNGVVSQGNFSNIQWGGGAKFLHVMMGTADLGTQQMMSVPYALYSNGVNVDVSPTGDTLTIGGNSVIVPGISSANVVTGCTNLLACNFNISANVDDGSCLITGASCDDGNSNTTNDRIRPNCECLGLGFVNGLFAQGSGVSDIDGNFYPSIVVNNQEWTQKNLMVTKYRNGDEINTNLDDISWSNSNEGAFSMYSDGLVNYDEYGKLYNWFAVNDSRGLCPAGWSVPSTSDWNSLVNFLNDFGQSQLAMRKLRADTIWNYVTVGNSSNESGFSALPAGWRTHVGGLYNMIDNTWWWTRNPDAPGFAWYAGGSSTIFLGSADGDVHDGLSIRCIKDISVPLILGCTNVQACNYNVSATQDDGSCLYPNATCDDGNSNTINDVINSSCICSGILIVNGCTNALACNYNISANVDDGSCLIQGTSCNDGNANTVNDVIGSDCLCTGVIPVPGIIGSQVLPGNNTCANEYISVTGCNGETSLTYDGRTYDLVEIGGQCWFADNLATDQYRNGDLIPTGLDNTTWQNTTAGAYAIYNNDPANDFTYGKLYNWFTTVDTRGLCPVGWHVPTDCEWMYLEGSLGMSVQQQQAINSSLRGSTEGGALKATTNWNSPNIGATNSSGFTALPGGYRRYNGLYLVIGNYGYLWSSSGYASTNAWYRDLYYMNYDVNRYTSLKPTGYSVRCLKD
jgi:uncharacterized protein (TIGR02145 family)